MGYEIGSVWRKWDLHIHTPASFHWNGKRLDKQSAAEKRSTLEAMIDRINATDVDAFGIMDYWTFDGYLALREYLNENPAASTKAIFAGIEFRLEAPTNFRLNTHVIFCNTVTAETLRNFLARLAIGGPNGAPPTRENFIALARTYDAGKLRLHGMKEEDKSDDEKMLLLGLKTAVITRESLERALELVPDESKLIIQPYDTSDGLEDLDWKRHPFQDSYLMKLADVFETRDELHVNLFLGNGHPTRPTIGSEFIDNLGGYAKPVVSGSDAHRISDYGVYPSNRITWLKAQPTFSGLQQVTHEPHLRCFIGVKPPKAEHYDANPTKYLIKIMVEKTDPATTDENWFDGVSLELNPGLIALIGNKGSGKSALADIIALAGNSHVPEMEFLNDQRFRRGKFKAQSFVAALTWADGTEHRIRLDEDPNREEPERVRYLPQQFIERLCNEIASGSETNFERELKKVIFSHVPEEKRLGMASLDELLEFTVESHRRAISQLQERLAGTNAEIIIVEREMSPETIKTYQAALSLKQSELDAHDRMKPVLGAAPKVNHSTPAAQAATAEVEKTKAQVLKLEQNYSALRSERNSIVARGAVLARLSGHINNFSEAYATFIEKHQAEFAAAGFELQQLVKLTVNRIEIDTASGKAAERLADLAALIDGSGANKSLEQQIEDAKARLLTLQAALDAPQKEYQEALTKLAQWTNRRLELIGTPDKPDTLQYLLNRIENAEKNLPTRLSELRQERLCHVRAIHAELLQIRAVHQELYRPVQQVASRNKFATEALHLHFDAFLSPSQFEDNFLDFIHRNRKGNFYGDQESRESLHKLFENRDFNDTDDVVAFLEALMSAMTSVDRGGFTEAITIQSQLKQSKRLADFCNFLYQIAYLEPRYTLKLGDKDISQLSPGEKGALLLVFYLLLDQDEIPIIIDQPEQNLDNESVVTLLVDCIRRARSRRQVIIVTHNPNLAVVCDADQIIYSRIDKSDGNKITYTSGAIEDNMINKLAVDVLEGTYKAFSNRSRKYHKPDARPAPPLVSGSAPIFGTLRVSGEIS